MKNDMIKFAVGSLASLLTYLLFNYMSNFVKASEFSKHKLETTRVLIEIKKDVEYIKKKVDRI